MTTLVLILFVLGFVLVVLQVVNVPSPPRFNLGWAGVACWMLAFLLQRVGG